MIDWDRVRDLQKDVGKDSFDDVVALFLEEMSECIMALGAMPGRAHLEANLHAIKNGALNLGLVDLACLCQEAEKRAADGDAPCVDLNAIRAIHDQSIARFRVEWRAALQA